VLVVGFPAQAFDTNCYVVAPAAGEECLVVDPGIGIEAKLDEVLAEHRLRPVAVLLTHGHLDHVFAVTPVCGAKGVPAYIHSDDRSRLEDPSATFGPALRQMFGGRLDWAEPDDVLELSDGMRLQLAGLDLGVVHAPGHTEGSVLFLGDGEGDVPPHCFTGDVLFAGSIGRTDLPGGDGAAMVRSLRDKVLPLADETVVLPGHGPRTTIARERRTNPYLLELGTAAPPTRGL
jgi:glyoxylase-like metal-dependent hydrolase (beta-lactamase superfamily II)